MRLLIITLIVLSACNSGDDAKQVRPEHPVTPDLVAPPAPVIDSQSQQKLYENARFKNVSVTKTGTDSYRIKGEGQIFEASFSWVIEDGHNELKSGFTTTDAGAPAWGKFDFVVTASKERENSVLHIILFEASAKDGRRTHELPVPLPS